MNDMTNRHPRRGKTDRDRRTGSWARHIQNQEKRREWNRQYATAAKAGSVRPLPYPAIGR